MNQKKQYVKDSLIIGFVLISSVIIFLFRNHLDGLEHAGYAGVFLLCLISNSTVLLPSPGLTVILAAARVLSPVPVALIGALGTSIGEFTGYALGASVVNLSEKGKKWSDFFRKYIKNTEILLFLFAFLPLPLFDAAGMYAGSRKMHPARFFLICYIGKALKMVIYALAAGYFYQWAQAILG